jgi:hypothetical protein
LIIWVDSGCCAVGVGDVIEKQTSREILRDALANDHSMISGVNSVGMLLSSHTDVGFTRAIGIPAQSEILRVKLLQNIYIVNLYLRILLDQWGCIAVWREQTRQILLPLRLKAGLINSL